MKRIASTVDKITRIKLLDRVFTTRETHSSSKALCLHPEKKQIRPALLTEILKVQLIIQNSDNEESSVHIYICQVQWNEESSYRYHLSEKCPMELWSLTTEPFSHCNYIPITYIENACIMKQIDVEHDAFNCIIPILQH